LARSMPLQISRNALPSILYRLAIAAIARGWHAALPTPLLMPLPAIAAAAAISLIAGPCGTARRIKPDYLSSIIDAEHDKPLAGLSSLSWL
jgi:hypothetical protein